MKGTKKRTASGGGTYIAGDAGGSSNKKSKSNNNNSTTSSSSSSAPSVPHASSGSMLPPPKTTELLRWFHAFIETPSNVLLLQTQSEYQFQQLHNILQSCQDTIQQNDAIHNPGSPHNIKPQREHPHIEAIFQQRSPGAQRSLGDTLENNNDSHSKSGSNKSESDSNSSDSDSDNSDSDSDSGEDSGVDNIVLLAQTMRLKRSSGYRRQCHECFKMYVKPSNGFCYACSPEFEQLLVVERNDINAAISRLIKDDGYKALMKEWHSRENEGTYDHPVDPNDCTNRQKRLILYYKAFNWFYSGA